MASVFDYIFNIGGNFTAQISGMSAAAGNFTAQAEVAESRGRSLASTLASFSYIKDIAQNVADGFSQLSSAGIKLDSQMHDLSAVAGVTGEGLKQIETFARQSAKTFGTDAAVAVEGYKLLLSQLSPELGKYPEALSAMGDCIQTTSKLDTNYSISKQLTEINNIFYENHNDNEINYISDLLTGNQNYYSKIVNEINRYFNTNQFYQTNNRYYEIFSEKHENNEYITLKEYFNNFIEKNDIIKFFDSTKTINEITDNTYNVIHNLKDNTRYNSFSIFESPIVKLGDQLSRFAENVTDNYSYNTVNYSEELNSLEYPSYSTTLTPLYLTTLNRTNYTDNIYNYADNIQIDNGINNNIINQNYNNRILRIGDVNPKIHFLEKNKKKERNKREQEIEILRKEEQIIESKGLSTEDIEMIVTEMFRREVEICSY